MPKNLPPSAFGWLELFAKKRAGLLALGLLLLMLGLGLVSSRGDSAVYDEVAHISAGYSYVSFCDYRLNPERPPLMKDLAGLSLQFLSLAFPFDEPSWTKHVNDQWEIGRRFLYTVGNDPDQILFWARLPLLLFAVGFGGALFVLCRQRWGGSVALLALYFYALSPNVLAHARYVTTDVGASAFFFLALLAYVSFVKRPRAVSLCLLALALAAAQVAEFSAVTVFAYLGLVTLVVIATWSSPAGLARRAGVYGGGLVIASLLSVGLVWLFYVPHTMYMPRAVQDQLIQESLTGRRLSIVAERLARLNDKPLSKPLAEYLLGAALVVKRIVEGELSYFNGEVSLKGFRRYFPELFLVKTQVGFLVLMVLGFGALVVRNPVLSKLGRVRGWVALLRERFTFSVLGGFSLFYFVLAIFGNLELGIRYLLPMYVPLFVVVAVSTVRFWHRLAAGRASAARTGGLALIAAMLLWYGVSCVRIHPSYTSYFNELIGGPDNSNHYFADSSVDWGQDLRRLKQYVDSHPEIHKLAIDYFGGGDVRYYFCARSKGEPDEGANPVADFDCTDSAYDEWAPNDGPYLGDYIAISETKLENDRFSANQYADLRARAPDAKVGYSIFLYKLH
jgi:hypothetical protein